MAIMGRSPATVAAQTLFTLLATWLSWWIWRFKIRPRLYPQEPKELPYWIPFIGHAASFFMGFNGAVEKGRKHFAPSREPFAMTVAGQTVYVATAAEDINHVWNNTKTISLNPLTMELYTWMSISAKSRKALFEGHPEARYNAQHGRTMTPTQMAIELQHQQLQKGQRLDALMKDKILPSFFEQMVGLETNDPAVLSRSAKSCAVSLLGLCINVFITGHTDAYFGPELRQVQPSIIKAFEDWEQCNWKFLFQLPDVFAKDMLRAKDTITGAFANFYRLPRRERPNSIFFVNGLEDMLREVGLSEEEMGKFTLLHYWAIVGNNYKLAFWLLAHLVFDPALQEQIRQEVLSAVRGDTVDEAYLLEQCPRLESLFNEMLRLTVSSSLARVVTETTAVGGKTLKAGNKIMLPIKELHFDPQIWGSDSTKLQPNRFKGNAKLAKSPSYRPWGGGHTLCPGRLFARRSINAFVAILLSRYELQAESTTFPKADGARPSPGVILVAQDQDVRLKCTPRF